MLQPAQQNFHLNAEQRQVPPGDPEEHYPKIQPGKFPAGVDVGSLKETSTPES